MDKGSEIGALPSDRAGPASPGARAGLRHSGTITSAWRARLRNWWRKQTRAPYVADMRLIALEHRHLYKREFKSAINCGTAIGLLMLAWRRGHFRSQRSPTPKGVRP